MSKQKLLFLPYADSDHIFSIICEETGRWRNASYSFVYSYFIEELE